MGRLVQLSRANSRDLEGSTGGEGRKEGRGVLKRMDGRGERKACINYRSNVPRLEQSREREKGKGKSGLYKGSLSRNVVQSDRDSWVENAKEENAWNWTYREGRGVFNSVAGHVFQIEDNGKLRDAKWCNRYHVMRVIENSSTRLESAIVFPIVEQRLMKSAGIWTRIIVDHLVFHRSPRLFRRNSFRPRYRSSGKGIGDADWRFGKRVGTVKDTKGSAPLSPQILSWERSTQSVPKMADACN